MLILHVAACQNRMSGQSVASRRRDADDANNNADDDGDGDNDHDDNHNDRATMTMMTMMVMMSMGVVGWWVCCSPPMLSEKLCAPENGACPKALGCALRGAPTCLMCLAG